MSFTEKQARDAIAERVQTATSSQRVYSFNCLNYRVNKDGKADLSEWAALFKRGGTLHGWVVKLAGIEAEELGGNCYQKRLFYDVWGFYGFNSAGTNASNSDDEFSAILENVQASFLPNATITVNSEQVLTTGLQFPFVSVLRAGETLMHYAKGDIELIYNT